MDETALFLGALALVTLFRRKDSATMTPTSGMTFALPHYPPFAPETDALFTEAAIRAGLPPAWAKSASLHLLLAKESQGWVGIPNYHFGDYWGGKDRDAWPLVWDAIRKGTWRDLVKPEYRANPSSATGLGQLTITNIQTGRFYPSGPNGIGNAIEEAIGMLRYIATHPGYGDPDRAWNFHQANNWY